jgi:hypothetical protein
MLSHCHCDCHCARTDALSARSVSVYSLALIPSSSPALDGELERSFAALAK